MAEVVRRIGLWLGMGLGLAFLASLLLAIAGAEMHRGALGVCLIFGFCVSGLVHIIGGGRP